MTILPVLKYPIYFVVWSAVARTIRYLKIPFATVLGAANCWMKYAEIG